MSIQPVVLQIGFTIFTICSFILLLTYPVLGAELPETIRHVKAGIVALGTFQATRRPSGRFIATGFVVNDALHVITSAHAIPRQLDVRNREAMVIFYRSGGALHQRETTLEASDPDHDLAVLRFEGRPLPALKLGDDRKVEEGRRVAFTGFPIGAVLGLHAVTHAGIVSAITPYVLPPPSARKLDGATVAKLRKPFLVFQLDAIAYRGNSGSPLYDPQTGKVFGVLSSVFVKHAKERLLQDPSGIAYAIPIRHAKALLAQRTEKLSPTMSLSK